MKSFIALSLAFFASAGCAKAPLSPATKDQATIAVKACGLIEWRYAPGDESGITVFDGPPLRKEDRVIAFIVPASSREMPGFKAAMKKVDDLKNCLQQSLKKQGAIAIVHGSIELTEVGQQ